VRRPVALLLIPMLALLTAPFTAIAHEVRPAYLEITEHADHTADVLWKRPLQGEFGLAIHPKLDHLLDRAANEDSRTTGFILMDWHRVPLGKTGLAGRSVWIEGLSQSITDTLLVVRFSNGDVLQQILTPGSPGTTIDEHRGAAVLAYLRLGIEHILTGVDHLLFVFGLILLSPSLRSLLRTITAFTAAHSITLALTALKLLSLNPALVEAMVAFSILFLAVELVRKQSGEDGLTLRYPWIIAFAFGLLHGAAFAGALKEVGLPEGNIPAALLMFNVGVEIGQLMFVATILTLLAGLRRLRLPACTARSALTAATYAIGIFSSFWVFERLGAALTLNA
jgi:hydrogenase/urease accessory protein HupE